LARLGYVYHRGSSPSFVGKMPQSGQNHKNLARNLLRLTRMGFGPACAEPEAEAVGLKEQSPSG
jgi:hypothetical protein